MLGGGPVANAATPFEAAARQTVARYRRSTPAAAWFVAGKLRRDPVYRQLAERGPHPGPIVDLGCGLGHTGLLLAALQPGASVLGLDWDLRKLRRARRAAAGIANVRFARADIRRLAATKAGTVLLLDVLHYHPPAEQDALLAAAAALLTPGGRLWVRDLDTAAGWRATATRAQERLARWMGWHRGATLHFRPAAELVGVLQGIGLHATVQPSWQGTPFGNVLITAVRSS
ncbi:MAG: class I SAM-dependent methyltransferase [Thermoanaerobaculia bacterium]